MAKSVQLSEKTQVLIEHFNNLAGFNNDLYPLVPVIDAEVLVAWLSNSVLIPAHVTAKTKKELEFTLVSLRVELFRDLLLSMGIKHEILSKQEKAASQLARLKFYFLAISGALFAACEGFDSITTLLSVFSLPALVTLLAGFAFSILSVAVFAGFNLVQVSKNLDIKLTDAPKLLDLYVLQMVEIKSIRKKIASYNLATLSRSDLEHLSCIVLMLQKRLASLGESCQQFAVALNSSKVGVAKAIFGGLSGILFFGSGFFAGQSVAVFLLSLAIAGGVSASFAPVVLFSLAVGFAAFSVYWYVEKVGLQQLISGWFGLDEDKIAGLCEQEQLNMQAQKLNVLQEQVDSMIEKNRILERLTPELTQESDAEKGLAFKALTQVKVSSTIYSFLKAEKDKTIRGMVPGEAVLPCASNSHR